MASDSNSIQSSRNSKTSWHHDDSHKRKRETEAKKRKWRGSRIHTHPTDLKLPGYAPNFLTQSTIVSVYGLSSLLVVSLIWILSGRYRKLAKIDRLLMCWWAFTGLTHLILEGYFVLSPEFYKDKTAHYLAEVWKEYSKGDSRYAARDAATVTVEGVTAVVEGPASLLAVYAIASGKSYSYTYFSLPFLWDSSMEQLCIS